MSDKRKMKAVIRRVSMLQAFRNTRIVMLIIMGLGMLGMYIMKVKYQPAIVAVGIIYFFTPVLVRMIVSDKGNEKSEEDEILPTLQQAYGYSVPEYCAQMAGFYATIIYLLLWIRLNPKETGNIFQDNYPRFLLISIIIVFLILYLKNRIKVPFLLKNNRL